MRCLPSLARRYTARSSPCHRASVTVRDALPAERVRWDVVESCEIVGAADNKIKNPVYNDIPDFLAQRPTIRRIILNGSTARRLFEQAFASPSAEVVDCLSTSPANQKYGAWPLLLADWSPQLLP